MNDDAVDLTAIVSVLAHRWFVIFMALGIGAGAVIGFDLAQPEPIPVYEGETVLIASETGFTSYIPLLVSKTEVIAERTLPQLDGRPNVTARLDKDSGIVRISARDRNRRAASDLANEATVNLLAYVADQRLRAQTLINREVDFLQLLTFNSNTVAFHLDNIERIHDNMPAQMIPLEWSTVERTDQMQLPNSNLGRNIALALFLGLAVAIGAIYTEHWIRQSYFQNNPKQSAVDETAVGPGHFG